jgi:hypothetical protein
MREVAANDCGAASAGERKGEVTGATTYIQDKRVRAIEDISEAARYATAPQAVKRKRKNMVQKVVTRGDATKHFAYAGGGVVFADCAFRPRTKRSGLCRHGLRAGAHFRARSKRVNSFHTKAISAAGTSTPV